MRLNADFSQSVRVAAADQTWVPSPIPGVERVMLDRVGGEVAWATSLVRYAPGSQFSVHTHAGGEEFLVLQGVFQDEHGDYPAGSYVRNPPGSSHTPGSAAGCTILVKLWQFDPDDAQPHVCHSNWQAQTLFENAQECVSLIELGPNQAYSAPSQAGFECFVLRGDTQRLAGKDWFRSTDTNPYQDQAGPQGALLWVKSGHLQDVESRLARLPE